VKAVEPFTYNDMAESLGCSRSAAERAVKAAGDCVDAGVSGRSKLFTWQG